eukprot:6400679-Amphidinium_carterae.1
MSTGTCQPIHEKCCASQGLAHLHPRLQSPKQGARKGNESSDKRKFDGKEEATPLAEAAMQAEASWTRHLDLLMLKMYPNTCSRFCGSSLSICTCSLAQVVAEHATNTKSLKDVRQHDQRHRLEPHLHVTCCLFHIRTANTVWETAMEPVGRLRKPHAASGDCEGRFA